MDCEEIRCPLPHQIGKMTDMKKSIGIILSIAYCAAAFLGCGRSGDDSSSLKRQVSADAAALRAEMAKLPAVSADEDVAEKYRHVADRVCAFNDASDRKELLTAFQKAVKKFPWRISPWHLRMRRICAYERLMVRVADGFCDIDAVQSVNALLDVFRTYADEIVNARKIAAEIESGHMAICGRERLDFQEYAHKLVQRYHDAVYCFEKWSFPKVKAELSSEELSALETTFISVTGRGIQSPEKAQKARLERAAELEKVNPLERWRHLIQNSGALERGGAF